jgi:hypothetical protein
MTAYFVRWQRDGCAVIKPSSRNREERPLACRRRGPVRHQDRCPAANGCRPTPRSRTHTTAPYQGNATPLIPGSSPLSSDSYRRRLRSRRQKTVEAPPIAALVRLTVARLTPTARATSSILPERGAYKREYLPGTLREKLFSRSRLLPPSHPVGAYRPPAACNRKSS